MSIFAFVLLHLYHCFSDNNLHSAPPLFIIMRKPLFLLQFFIIMRISFNLFQYLKLL